MLLLSCSKSERATSVPLPVSTLYTGPFFRLIAKARREHRWPGDIAIGIVSARHGFLEETDLLLPYESRIDDSRVQVLQSSIALRLDSFLNQYQPGQVLVAMGALYRRSLADSRELRELDAKVRVLWAQGGIGDQLHIVREWLS